ncbi:MAG: DNA polymerase I [Ignavibacteria bacterium]|nr:DNA polymerase I [Ignavibacteria bacterium]
MAERVFLIDAMAMIYRAYFALISRPLMTRGGKNTSAIYGFVAMLLKIIEEEKPDHIAVCFDTEKPTFRHNMFPSYKAQRQEIPSDMPWQIEKIKEIVKAFNISLLEVDGYEADDIIGTLCKKAEVENSLSFMVTPDKDFMQLVSDKTFQYKPVKGSTSYKEMEAEIIDKNAVITKFGVPPEKVVDVLGLMGDSSDNIPGVRGVGEKTAVALIQEFGSIENLYANIDKISKEKLKETLLKYKDDALLSKKLVTINTDVPLEISYHDLKIGKFDMQKIVKIFDELEFKDLFKRIETSKQIEKTGEISKPKKKDEQEEIKITIKATKIEPEKVDIKPVTLPTKKIKDIPHKYYTIKNHKDYEKFIGLLKQQELFAFDTETDSLDVMSAKLIGFSVSFEEHKAFYIPIHGEFGKKKIESESLFEISEKPEKETIPGVEINYAIQLIKPLLESDSIKKVGHNIKFDYLIMRNYGIEMKNIFFDTMVGAYILKPEDNYDMNSLAYRYLNYEPIHIEELIGKGKTQISMSEVPLDKVSEYAAEDADVTLQLYNKIKYELKKINLYKLCTDIEFPLIKVLAEMEFEGVRIDPNVLTLLDGEITKLIKEYEEKIYKSAGQEFNINSTQQLSKVLFEDLKLIPTKKTKTGYSTDISVLEELRYQHEICGLIIEYRGLTKLKSTYIDGLKKSINSKTNRVHTSFNQTGTSTGRLSSQNPNLQNIPIRTEIGKNIRKAFISREDYLIMAADYSQIELRIMAHFSNDENMIRAFKRKTDIHTDTARRIFATEEKKEITPGMRRKAKEVNFGIMYGIGVFGLANRLEIKNSEAKEIIDRYFREYPKVREYVENTKQFARENGYVQTLTGRRRYLPQINNQNATVRAEDERAAINMPIQGTAADMIKIAMIRIFNSLREKNLKSKLILQVHDELVLEVHKDEIEQVKEIVENNMKNALKLNVPIEVDIGIGKSWYEAH